MLGQPSARIRRAFFTLACLAIAVSTTAFAQTAFPTRPIRLLVSFATGSGNDLLARELAKSMTETLGQPVVVENKLGAGGMIATEAVVRASADGYVIGFGTSSQLVMNIGFYKNIAFDVDKDIAMIGLAARTNMVMEVAANGPSSVKDLIDRARAAPNAISYASGGNGSITHIVAEDFARHTGIQMLHVPYKGGGAAIVDLAGGHVSMMFDGLNNGAALADQGKIRLLAISGTKRNGSRPDLPTFAEAGVPGYEAYTWNALFAPANMPPAVMQALNAALNKALTSPGVKGFTDRNGGEIMGPSTPAQADAFAAKERARWVPMVRSMGIKE